MNARVTVFTAMLVQDSALSISGIDRERSADHPFATVDGTPILPGRGLKGAAVAMARRFFDLPPCISGKTMENGHETAAPQRSAWEFSNSTPEKAKTRLHLRAGIGIRHKTGARAGGALYDREVVPAGTRWPLLFRVDWLLAAEEAIEAEGILAYVLARQWAEGRCWLGGGVARGLGWCHIENLRTFRLDPRDYDRWVESGRKPETLTNALPETPIAEPSRSWCFRTLDVTLSFGEYRPTPSEPAWGLDMLAIGSHDVERTVQTTGDGEWAKPSWVPQNERPLETLSTDRAMLMDDIRPLLPGSSLRGPLRHAFSRAKTAAGQPIRDPLQDGHSTQGTAISNDAGDKLFGTVRQSSRVLIRDGRAEAGWAAARLHMHAEDEFSAGSYKNAKRDAVRLLRGVFPIRIVIEGHEASEMERLAAEIDHLVALGAIGHLPIGGHKTRGAGWGQWQAGQWIVNDVRGSRSPSPAKKAAEYTTKPQTLPPQPEESVAPEQNETAHIRLTNGFLDSPSLTLGEAAVQARAKLGDRDPIAWWCEPTIDLNLSTPPSVFGFGRHLPEIDNMSVDEVAFYASRAVWRASRTNTGLRWVFIEEIASDESSACPGEVREARIVHTPARLHGGKRFSSAPISENHVLLREWRVEEQLLGFTLAWEKP